MGRRLFVTMLAVLASTVVGAQRFETVTESRVRALTREAQSEAKGDKTDTVLALDRRFRERFGDFESFPITIVKREDLSVVLSTPFMSYRRALAEYLRMNDPIAKIPWISTAVINVGPMQLGAPDITRVVVERDGKPAQPSENLLKSMTFTNGNGDSARIHAGEIRFPMSVFAPGASVTISVVPSQGETFVLRLDDSQLATLK